MPPQGYQLANMEYAANFTAARALQEQAELLQREEDAGRRQAVALLKQAQAIMRQQG